MASMMFVNFAVDNLPRSKKFYEALGYKFNPKFTDENAGCCVLSETNFIMLLTKPFFAKFTDKKIVDGHKSVQSLLALSFDSKKAVDNVATKALANGGTVSRPIDDLGFMYTRAIADPDGHILEFFWMDPSAS